MANGCRIKRLFSFLFYLWMAKLFRCEGGYDVPEFGAGEKRDGWMSKERKKALEARTGN